MEIVQKVNKRNCIVKILYGHYAWLPGVFVVFVSSIQVNHTHYCLGELPYRIKQDEFTIVEEKLRSEVVLKLFEN